MSRRGSVIGGGRRAHRRWLVPALVLVLSAGCATVGKNFDATKLSWIKEGATTKADVLDRMGPPWRIGADAGDPTWTYGYYQYRVFGDSNSKDLVIHFRPDGTVKSYTMNTSFRDEREQLEPGIAGK